MIDLAIDNRVFIEDELDEAIQELDMIFNTENTELIGYPQYGTNWYQFLWQLNPSPNALKSYIYDKISTDSYFLSKMNVEIYVDVLEESTEGMYRVVIIVSNDNGKKIRAYNLR